jgi:hypothetical protein
MFTRRTLSQLHRIWILVMNHIWRCGMSLMSLLRVSSDQGLGQVRRSVGISTKCAFDGAMNGHYWTEIDGQTDADDVTLFDLSNFHQIPRARIQMSAPSENHRGSSPWPYTDLYLSVCKEMETHVYRYDPTIWDIQSKETHPNVSKSGSC